MYYRSWCGVLGVLLFLIGTVGVASDHRTAFAAAANPTPTKTPARTATRKPTPTATPPPPFYVSPRGNDYSAGTLANPWRTIQHAVSRLRAGQTALVEAGTYVERVSVTTSGRNLAPITIRAATVAGAKVLGFSISGSYWVIDGFDISTQSNSRDGYGVYVFGFANHDTIRNNYIHELCHEGIFMEPTVSSISVLNNRIWRAEMAGAQVDGLGNLIAGNQVWDTQQQPRALGGIYANCVTPGGADADGFRFFGQRHTFAANYIHDIGYGTKQNPNPHIDCFQTWGSGVMKVDAITFAGNKCRWSSATWETHAAMLEGSDGPVGTLVFKNNIFANMKDGVIIGEGQPSGVAAVKFWNNTFDHIYTEAVQFSDRRSALDEVVNNIFFDVGNRGDSYLCLSGSGPIIQANDFYMRGGVRPGDYCSSAPYISLNPLFANSGDSTGMNADYHLQSASPIRDRGVTETQVPTDYAGVKRPQGAAYSIGAFEK